MVDKCKGCFHCERKRRCIKRKFANLVMNVTRKGLNWSIDKCRVMQLKEKQGD